MIESPQYTELRDRLDNEMILFTEQEAKLFDVLPANNAVNTANSLVEYDHTFVRVLRILAFCMEAVGLPRNRQVIDDTEIGLAQETSDLLSSIHTFVMNYEFMGESHADGAIEIVKTLDRFSKLFRADVNRTIEVTDRLHELRVHWSSGQ